MSYLGNFFVQVGHCSHFCEEGYTSHTHTVTKLRVGTEVLRSMNVAILIRISGHPEEWIFKVESIKKEIKVVLSKKCYLYLTYVTCLSL